MRGYYTVQVLRRLELVSIDVYENPKRNRHAIATCKSVDSLWMTDRTTLSRVAGELTRHLEINHRIEPGSSGSIWTIN